QARQTLLSLCERTGFTLDPDVVIDQLTIGQRQQLEIVRQLALGVRTLILDEPTTGISTEQKQALFDALRHLAHDQGMSILLVSHKLEDVIALCDDVIVLRGGRLVGQASMPVTAAELVRLMFGQELPPPTINRQRPGSPVLELDAVSLRGQRVHIDRYSLRVCEREIIGLAGLDGSGQELILRACAGLVRPTHGHIRLNGSEMTGKSFRDFMAHGVAFSAAGRLEEGLIAGLSLTEHIALVNGRSALIDWGSARRVTSQQLVTYNVKGRPDDRIEALSGGNQQRMLMALMPKQPVLMALEHPTRGLDVDSTRWIWEQLLKRRDQGTAILFTSPDLDEIVTYSDRILVLFAGHVFEIADARNTTIDELGRLIGGHFEAAERTYSRN
ncbi:MAG: ATP-binding cassette domain-containing protein, partial [Anaerolinea sp.]|nr:ATP-binding cassette domain-containing protein [Anaerolinea sp.]